MDRRESISSNLNAKDEAALVDSFFLPGGILDPDQEEEQEENPTPKGYPVPVATTTTDNILTGPGTTASDYEWNDEPTMVVQHPTCVAAEVDETTEEEAAEPSTSFWSTAVNSNNNPYDQQGQPYPANDTSAPEPWLTAPTLAPNNTLAGSINEHEYKQEEQNLLQSPAPCLFPPYNNDSLHSSQDSNLVVANLNNQVTNQHPLQNAHPLNLGEPLQGTSNAGGGNDYPNPAPSAQEAEDVRKMVLALSSSLHPVGESSEHPLPEHLLQPDSPPKIIRHHSSLSTSHNLRMTSSSIPLELLNNGAGGGEDEDVDDFYEEQQSTTSSLSSGSAKRDDSYHSHTSVPLSVHYCPPQTAFLPELPKEPFLLGGQQQDDGLFPTTSNHQQLPTKQQWSSPLLPRACLPSPPGFEHLPPPPPLPFPTVERLIPPPPTTTTQPPISLNNVPAPPSPPNDAHCQRRPFLSTEAGGACDEDSWQQVCPKDPPGHDQQLEESTHSSIAPVNLFGDDPDYVPKPSTTTTKTTTTATAVIMTGPPAASPSKNTPTPTAPTTTTTSNKRRRSGRKQKSSQKKGADTVAKEPQLHQNDVFKTGKSPVSSQAAAAEQQSATTKTKTEVTTKKTTTSRVTKQKPVSSGTNTVQQSNTSILDVLDNTIDFTRRCFKFKMSLLSCMIQEAAKEAFERRSIASYYAAIYFTPVISDWIMDQLVWLPFFFPGVTLAIVLVFICRSMEKDQYLIETAAFSPSLLARQVPRTSSSSPKKKTRQESLPRTLSQSEHRVQELRSMEAKVCLRLLRNLRWALPTMTIALALFDKPPEYDCVPTLRLVAAFGLSMLQTFNLFSPLAWISASLQILLALSLRNSHTYMERWFGVEVLIGSLGLSTLRFLRLGGADKRKHV